MTRLGWTNFLEPPAPVGAALAANIPERLARRIREQARSYEISAGRGPHERSRPKRE